MLYVVDVRCRYGPPWRFVHRKPTKPPSTHRPINCCLDILQNIQLQKLPTGKRRKTKGEKDTHTHSLLLPDLGTCIVSILNHRPSIQRQTPKYTTWYHSCKLAKGVLNIASWYLFRWSLRCLCGLHFPKAFRQHDNTMDSRFYHLVGTTINCRSSLYNHSPFIPSKWELHHCICRIRLPSRRKNLTNRRHRPNRQQRQPK